MRQPLRSLEAVERGAGQIVLALVHGGFGLAHPVFAGLLVFTPLLFQHVLVGDGNRDLRLGLEILVLHVEDHLFDHFFRIFRAVHHVIDVRANQSAYSFQESHDKSPFTNRMMRTT